MDQTYKFRVVAWWASGQTGITKSDAASSALHFPTPRQFGGVEGRWTPEDLLLSAVASCFTTTFQAIATISKFSYLDLEVEVSGTVAKTSNGYGFTAIVIRPKLKVSEEGDQIRALELFNKTKTLCLVSRALEPPQEFEPVVAVDKLAPVGWGSHIPSVASTK